MSEPGYILTYRHNYEGWDRAVDSFFEVDTLEEGLKKFKELDENPDEYSGVSLSVVIKRWSD